MGIDKTTALYETFKSKLQVLSGECFRVNTAKEAGELVCKVMKEKGINNVALLNLCYLSKGRVCKPNQPSRYNSLHRSF